jgi:hypothetical protein
VQAGTPPTFSHIVAEIFDILNVYYRIILKILLNLLIDPNPRSAFASFIKCYLKLANGSPKGSEAAGFA